MAPSAIHKGGCTVKPVLPVLGLVALFALPLHAAERAAGSHAADSAQIQQLVERFKGAIRAKDGETMRGLFLPGGSWLQGLDKASLAAVRAREPKARQFIPGNYEQFAKFVGSSPKPIEETFDNVRIETDGVVGEIAAQAVVLATGGIGQAWNTTTNPATATGDGLALALRAGALLRDVEFTQFHPTVLVVPEAYRRPGDRGVLVSEAVRGEGAVLIDRRGELIMKGRHPLADLAPRDIVSAAIHEHLMTTGDDHVFLDGTRLGERVWREHFPSILMLCRARGVDPITEPIPVRPAEHYSCGGVLATMDGRTSVPGLYAVGEVASTGVQGANRLASNSLTEALIAGDRAGQLLASRPADGGSRQVRRNDEEGATPAEARDGIVAAVSVGAGVLREGPELSVLLKSLDGTPRVDLARSAADVTTTNLRTVGVLVAAAASSRTESRGCHRRSDFQLTDRKWERHTLLRLGPDGLEISTQAKES
jgi:aspartate oxidase